MCSYNIVTQLSEQLELHGHEKIMFIDQSADNLITLFQVVKELETNWDNPKTGLSNQTYLNHRS